MISKMTPERALERLEALCSRSEHCTGELLQKLRTWKIEPEDAEAIIDSLRRRRFLDDERFARAFVYDKYRFNHWGRIKIRIEMRAKGLTNELIDAAMEEIDEKVYNDSLSELLEAKMKTIVDDDLCKRRQKLFRAAVSRGFETELVSLCLAKFLRT